MTEKENLTAVDFVKFYVLINKTSPAQGHDACNANCKNAGLGVKPMYAALCWMCEAERILEESRESA